MIIDELRSLVVLDFVWDTVTGVPVFVNGVSYDFSCLIGNRSIRRSNQSLLIYIMIAARFTKWTNEIDTMH